MVVVCAWCKKLLGYKPPLNTLISHGICGSCYEVKKEEIKVFDDSGKDNSQEIHTQ